MDDPQLANPRWMCTLEEGSGRVNLSWRKFRRVTRRCVALVGRAPSVHCLLCPSEVGASSCFSLPFKLPHATPSRWCAILFFHDKCPVTLLLLFFTPAVQQTRNSLSSIQHCEPLSRAPAEQPPLHSRQRVALCLYFPQPSPQQAYHFSGPVSYLGRGPWGQRPV